jgi:hypothetical protein
MLLFERPYMERLIDIGYHDAAGQHDEIADFLGESVAGPNAKRSA